MIVSFLGTNKIIRVLHKRVWHKVGGLQTMQQLLAKDILLGVRLN